MQIDFEKFVEWDEQIQRFVFTGAFTGEQGKRLPLDIFACFGDAKVRDGDTKTAINEDGEFVFTGFSGILDGVVDSANPSNATGLSTSEMLAHSDFVGDYFRAGLILSDDKDASMATVRKLLKHASLLGQTLEQV